jgi:CspA family cold shock protein
MRREKRPDEIAREAASVPAEPRGTRRTATGTVKWFRDDKGHGVIATDETAPWDIWFHYSSIDAKGFVRMSSGERVPIQYNEEGDLVLPSGERISGQYNLEASESRTPHAGERVEVEYDRADQESFKYVAHRVRRLDASDSETSPTR